MCINCYIGTEQEINEIPFAWSNPTFCIMKVDKSNFDEETFMTENVYYIGTSNGCGCDFGTEEIPERIIIEAKQCLNSNKEFSPKVKQFFEFEDTIEFLNMSIENNKKYSKDTQKLYSLISDLSLKNKTIEFFGCQADHEMNKCDQISTMEWSQEVKIDFEKFQELNIKIIIKNDHPTNRYKA